jgi:hypothetical protein
MHMSDVFSIKPEEVVRNYNLAIDARDKAIKLDRDASMRSGFLKFMMNIIGKGYAKTHNEAMSGVSKAQGLSEFYAQQHSIELQTMARAEAEAELRKYGKVLKVPKTGIFETATNVRLTE